MVSDITTSCEGCDVLARPHHHIKFVCVGKKVIIKLTDMLEKVQRHTTKYVQGLSHLPYETCLEKLLYSLFCRCKQDDMIETYKVLNNYYNIDPSLFFKLNSSSSTRDLFKERSRLLVRQSFSQTE